MWKAAEICCIRRKPGAKHPALANCQLSSLWGKKGEHPTSTEPVLQKSTLATLLPPSPPARMICKCSGKGCSSAQTLSATNQGGLALYYTKSAKCTVAVNTHSYQALLSCWQPSLGEEQHLMGPAALRTSRCNASKHLESPASLLRGQGCQRGLRQPRKVRDAPAGPHSHAAWDTEEMAVLVTLNAARPAPPAHLMSAYPTVCPSECLLRCTLPVLESPASCAASLGSAWHHPAPVRFGGEMCCGDMAQEPGSSATSPGPPWAGGASPALPSRENAPLVQRKQNKTRRLTESPCSSESVFTIMGAGLACEETKVGCHQVKQ